MSQADPFSTVALDPRGIRDLSPQVLDGSGRMKILPSEFWASTTPAERALFGHTHAIYAIPTTELVEHLRQFIAGRKAIEIGAGNGVLADALGITATDNRMQARSKYKRIFAQTGQPTVTYGRNIIERDAYEAVRRYEPEVVIGCWITHRYDPARHWAGGNEIGVDEMDVLAHCQEYVLIGNDKIHGTKVLWDLPHAKTYPPFVYSRAANGTKDFIAVWPNSALTQE
jgi:hypothetical protein